MDRGSHSSGSAWIDARLARESSMSRLRAHCLAAGVLPTALGPSTAIAGTWEKGSSNPPSTMRRRCPMAESCSAHNSNQTDSRSGVNQLACARAWTRDEARGSDFHAVIGMNAST